MSIVIINTNCANLQSIKIAIKRLGYQVIISDHKRDIIHAKKIFLPGVGSAKAVMQELYKKNLVNLISKLQQPVLGICLGMQLFSKLSEENNNCNMLNLIPYLTVKLNNAQYVVPHIGWNSIEYVKENILFRNISTHARFYFLHSYCIYPNKYTIAVTEHGSLFSAAIQKNNFFGVQFHPEKSGIDGLKLIKNFLEI